MPDYSGNPKEQIPNRFHSQILEIIEIVLASSQKLCRQAELQTSISVNFIPIIIWTDFVGLQNLRP